jgi:hypothetical protein
MVSKALEQGTWMKGLQRISGPIRYTMASAATHPADRS